MRMTWKNLLAGLAVAVALSSGAHAQTRSLTVDGMERSYIVHRPAGLARGSSVPLVIVLHGGLGSGAQAEHAYHWDETTDRNGFVAAYPDGHRRSWNAGGLCCGPAHRDRVDDVAFLTALIERLSRDEDIDPRRVYLAGISNGAAMAYRYACEGAFPIAAIGSVAGSLAFACPKPHPLSLMEIHGLKDRTVKFDGGPGKWAKDVDWLGVDASLKGFLAADGCATPLTQQNGVVETTSWSCAARREVRLITIADAGHQWPGSSPERGLLARLLQLDPPSEALDATAELWNFFARHPRD